MVFFNYSTMQMAAKVVYYGPGLCGKTTNLHYIYGHTTTDSRGEMVSLETETDRTLFFDLLPLDVGSIAGFNTRIQLYTVPGQVFYNTTRKLVLKGVDGVVFVVDSQRAMLQANLDSFRNLEENLTEMGLAVDSLPLVMQYNKRDLTDIYSVEELNKALNRHAWPYFEASAVSGQGVFETLKGVSKYTLLALKRRLGRSGAEAPARLSAPGAGPAPRPAAAVSSLAPVPPLAPPASLAPLADKAAASDPEGPGTRAAPGPSGANVEAASAGTAAAPSSSPAEAPAALDRPAGASQGSAPATPEGVVASQGPAAPNLLQVKPPVAEAAGPRPPLTSQATGAGGATPAAVASQTGPVQGHAGGGASGPAANPAAPPKRSTGKSRSFDVLTELEKLRREAMQPAASQPAHASQSAASSAAARLAARSAAGLARAAAGNGRAELSRNIELTLKRSEFARARRVLLSFQVEDEQHRVVDAVRDLPVEIKDTADLEKLLLHFNIALHAKE
jgi:signal recognition particle receptor subunit beta